MTDGSAGFHQGTASPWDTDYHSPALAAEVVQLLGGSALVLDGTLGGGGHSKALLDHGVGKVIGLDRDPDALAAAGARLAEEAARGHFAAYQGNYAAIDAIPAIADLRFTGGQPAIYRGYTDRNSSIARSRISMRTASSRTFGGSRCNDVGRKSFFRTIQCK